MIELQGDHYVRVTGPEDSGEEIISPDKIARKKIAGAMITEEKITGKRIGEKKIAENRIAEKKLAERRLAQNKLAGAGAHSYAASEDRAWRWWNIARPRRGRVEADREELPPRQADAERLMLGLRTRNGLEPPQGFDSRLEDLERLGLLERSGSLVRPTRRGLDLHNQVALAVL